MPEHLVPQAPSQRITNLDASLQELKDYVHLKAVQEPAATTVDFETAKTACFFLFTNFVNTQKAGNFSTHAIPDLLEVLRYIETYRLRIIHQAEMALDPWQEYYEKEDPERALSEEEATIIGEIATPTRNWREVYFKIVDKLIGLDLHCIFVSKNWSLSEFMARLFEYSPSSFRSSQGYQPSPLKFVKFLSKEENFSVTTRCRKSLKRISHLHKWLQENHPDCFANFINSPDFEKIYPLPSKIDVVFDLIHHYLHHVSHIYDTLTTILPTKTENNE